MTILPMDGSAPLKKLKPHFEDDSKRQDQVKAGCGEIIDELLDLFLLAYDNGVKSVNASMGANIRQSDETRDSVIYEMIDGKTWKDRVWDYYENGGDVYDIARIASTEAHRDANEAAYDTAVRAGATKHGIA